MNQKKQQLQQAQQSRVCDIVPRKAPKEVIEHRITFGDFERKELRDVIKSYQQDKILENVPNIMMGTAGVVVAGTVAAVGYALYYWLDSVPSIVDSWKNRFQETVEAPAETLRSAISRAKYSRFSTLEEVNAAYDKQTMKTQETIAKAQRIITLHDEGKLGNFSPDWFINAQRMIVANEAKTMAALATERAEYISQWQEWKANEPSSA